MNSAPGRRTAAVSQRCDVVAVDGGKVVERSGVVAERHRDAPHRRELLDVGAEEDAVGARELAHPVEVVETERDRLDEDVERADVLEGLGEHLLDFVHPRRRGVAIWHGVREQPRAGRDLGDDPLEFGGELERPEFTGGR
jgi:hypothetical protein